MTAASVPPDSTTRSARILAGLSANGFTQATQLIMRLAEVPVLLALWGAARYGEWLMVAALPTALSFSDGGFTKTARREMTMRAGRNDQDGISAVFQSAWLLLMGLSLISLSILALALPHLSVARLLRLSIPERGDLTLVLMALAGQVLIYFQCGLLHGAFTSKGRYATGEILIAASSSLSFIGILSGAALGGNLLGAAIGSLVGQIFGFGLMLAIYVRCIPSPRYGFRHASIAETKKLWGPSTANLAFPLADALNIQGVRLVVGLTLGPVALAGFSTLRTLCRTALQPVLSIARTLEPELSLACGAGNDELARKLFLRASYAGFWLSFIAAILVALVGPYFYAAWAGHHLNLDISTLCVMLAASTVNVIWGIALAVPCSVNKHARLALRFLALYGMGSIALVYAFSKFLTNSFGAAMGLIVGDMIAAFLVVTFAAKLANVSVAEWRAAVFRTPAPLVRETWNFARTTWVRRRSRKTNKLTADS